jgi:hypothetical protein
MTTLAFHGSLLLLLLAILVDRLDANPSKPIISSFIGSINRGDKIQTLSGSKSPQDFAVQLGDLSGQVAVAGSQTSAKDVGIATTSVSDNERIGGISTLNRLRRGVKATDMMYAVSRHIMSCKAYTGINLYVRHPCRQTRDA